MLTISPFKAGDVRALAKYFDSLAGAEDYYGNDQELDGYWMGSAASAIGLVGVIQKGEVVKALQGFHPIHGTPIAQNSGNGHKPGWDCTFSAPKSVSAIWAAADEVTRGNIETAHRQAVAHAIQFLEREAVVTRYGREGVIKVPAAESGGVVFAVFQHSTSREQDPQLHSHCLLMNFNPEGRGLDVDTRWQSAAAAFYRVELAQGMLRLGFSVERDDIPGREDRQRFFKVSGIPDALIEEWSKRREQVQEAKAEWLTDGATAARFTRKNKGEISREALFRQWGTQALVHGLDQDGVQRMRLAEPKGMELSDIPDLLERLTLHEATFTRPALVAALLEDAQGATCAAQALEGALEVMAHEDVIDIDGRVFTTRQMLELETAMVERAGQLAGLAHDVAYGKESQCFYAQVERIGQAKGLSDQQMQALRHITGDDRFSVIQGYAGTGKSYLLGAAREAWQQAGLDVRGVALANAAAQTLTKEAAIQSTSIKAFLTGLESGKVRLSARTVLIVDEAGMVGTRQMSRLLDAVESADAKLVLVGDSQQLQAVEAGGAMAGIMQKTGFVELTEVRRQVAEIDRRIAADLRHGNAGAALEALRNLNRLHVAPEAKAAQHAAVGAYLEDRAAGHSVLLLAGTNADTRNLNVGVHVELQKVGEVAPEGVLVKVLSGYREFAAGDRLLFKEACNLPRLDHDSPGCRVINGTFGKIVQVESTAKYAALLAVRLDDGEMVRVDTIKYNNIDYGYAMTVHKAQGATVDKVHVLMDSEILQGKQWAYVAGSRHRHEFHVYTTEQATMTWKERAVELKESNLAHSMSKTRQKGLAIDCVAAEAVRQVPVLERGMGLGDDVGWSL